MVEAVEVLLRPAILAVAPNGARRRRSDHPAIPVTPGELAATAVACRDAGACLLHLHVRDAAEGHVLDAAAYAEATAAVREAVGGEMIVQITTEAVGRHTPAEQMAVVRAVGPEAVSLALGEILPDGPPPDPAALAFLAELAEQGVLVQHILYSPAEVHRFRRLRDRGTLPPGPVFPLFVLGRHAAGQRSDPRLLCGFLDAWDDEAGPWAVCAFGPEETACLTAALALGGHARVGFENSLWRPDGRVAADNAESVARLRLLAETLGRPTADAATARKLLKP
jgi:uncharacterized protein (DUF849 family)